MASAAAPGTVWVGFMDVVPVIGTVKEGVEWVLALQEGNEKVVREKETLIKNFLEPKSKPPMQSVVKGVEKLSVFESEPSSQTKGEEDPEAAGASGPAGPKSITEVKLEELLEYVHCVSGKATKREAKEKTEEEQKRVQEIKKDALKKISLIKPDFVMAVSLDNATRSQKGEHVFNKDIIRFHSKVLEEFKRNMNISNDPKYEMADLNGHTLDPNTVENIQTNMVVHFLESEFYVNANAVLYGRFAEALRRALLDVMEVVYPELIRPDQREKVNYIIDFMNDEEIYVDHLAKMKWINESPANAKRFDVVDITVANMYRNDRGFGWCNRIMVILGALFEIL